MKQKNGCLRCGPVKFLLRFVTGADGFPKTVPWPADDPPGDKPGPYFYCPICGLHVATEEDEAYFVLEVKPPAEVSLDYW